MKKHGNIIPRSDSQQGIALLITIILVFVFMSVSIAVSGFAQQNLQLTTNNRESSYALYAADTGIECALYYDLKDNAFFDAIAESSDLELSCDGDSSDVETFENASRFTAAADCPNVYRVDEFIQWCFYGEFDVDNGLGQQYQVDLQYGYSDTSRGRIVTIVSQGFNDQSGTARLQQRELVYQYTI